MDSLTPKIRLFKGSIEISSDRKKLGKALFNSLFELGDFKASSAIKGLLETIKIESPLERKAFNLVFKSLGRACNQLMKEFIPERINEEPKLGSKQVELRQKLEQKLVELDCVLTPDFFDNPMETVFVEDFQKIFALHLHQFNLSGFEANELTSLLPSRFWSELIYEWKENQEYYKEIEEFFIKSSTPFLPAWQTRQKKLSYYSGIKASFHSPTAIQRDIRLSDVYINPLFDINERSISSRSKVSPDKEGYIRPSIDIDVHQFINDFFYNEKELPNCKGYPKSKFLIVLGQPGQGKTSFCLKVASDLLSDKQNNLQLFFLRFRDIERPRNFIQDPIGDLTVRLAEYNLPNSNCCIILDGLDELYLSSGLSVNQLKQVLYDLNNFIKKSDRTFLILTSRIHRIDPSHFSGGDYLIIKLREFNEKQQVTWLQKYSLSKGNLSISRDDLIKINKDPAYRKFRKIIDQPILLQLFVELGFSVAKSKNKAMMLDNFFAQIVDNVLSLLTNRTWSEDGQLKNLEEISYDPSFFRDYLATLALKIYQSPYEYLLYEQLLKLPETRSFIEKILPNQPEIHEDILSKILSSFYFKKIKRINEPTESHRGSLFAVEFYHKSLQEFLASEKIWSELKEELLAKKRGTYRLSTHTEILSLLDKLFGKSHLSVSVQDFLKEIIENDKDTETTFEIHERLIQSFPIITNSLFNNHPRPESFETPMTQQLNCFFGYWLVLTTIGIDEDLFKGTSYQNLNLIISALGRNNYHGLDFSSQSLKKMDLTLSYFSETRFCSSDLTETNFSNNLIENVLFKDIVGHQTIFKRAHLINIQIKSSINKNIINFKTSRWDYCSMTESSFSNIDFTGSNLTYSSIHICEFDNCIFSGISLLGSNLHNVKFENCDFTDVIFTKAHFLNCEFINCEFDTINLDKSCFQYSKIKGTNSSLLKIDSDIGAIAHETEISAMTDESFHKLKKTNIPTN
jgi:uncharacterized protein YjbI with pentapeptide repeats/sulfur relay (sulfurtransferase) DsrC/TusE family protein